MTPRRRPRIRPLLAAAAMLVFLLNDTRGAVAPAYAAPGDVAVVVHPRVGVDELSLPDLRKVLLGDRQFWPANQRVTLLLRGPGARERDVLLKRVYQMSEAQFRQYWIAKVFRAETAAGPKIVNSGQTAVHLAAAIPGAITFVDAGQIPQGLKVLKINGRLPGERGYPLQ